MPIGSRDTGTTLDSFRISVLLQGINEQQVVLPEFQRDFDWSDRRVKELLATIVRRWPAGSLLLQDFEEGTFYKVRAFEGGPEVDLRRAGLVVLDGQQRLTGLYHAVYDTGDHVYAIRARVLRPDTSIDDIEEGTVAFERETWDRLHRDAPWSEQQDWIPFYALKSPTDFFSWRDTTAERSPAAVQDDVRSALTEAYRVGLEPFHVSYELPAVLVERKLEPAAIARIFERVNRGGLRLNTFDLMVARTYEPDWNLRERWDDACDRHPLLYSFFKEDGMPVIRAIALKNQENVRESAVLDLPGPSVRIDWDSAVEATAKALTLLHDRFGVLEREWLSDMMLITLAGLAFEFDLADHERLLRRWFLSREYGLAYEVATNTVTVQEYLELRRALRGEVDALRATEVTRRTLQEATRRGQRGIWSAFLALLAMNGTRDALGDDREIVPFSPLEREPVAAGEIPRHLRVVGLVLAERGTRLNGKGLDAVDDWLHAFPERQRQRIERAQLLPPIDECETQEAFLEARLELLIERLERETSGLLRIV